MHKTHLPDWAVARGRYLNAFESIDPRRAALVVIDMQSAFLAAGAVFSNPYGLAIIPAVNALARAVRDAGGGVIWTRQSVSDAQPLAMAPWQYDRNDPQVRAAMNALTPGASSHDLHPDMAAQADDLVIDKYRYSAFACPAGGLAQALQARDVEMLIIAGTLTNVCCESTGRDAYMRGYKVMVLSDATAAVSDAEHNASLLNMRLNFADVQDSRTVIARLKQPENEGRL